MDDKTRQALDDIRKFLSHHEPYADSREVRCVTPFASEAPGMNLAAVRALYALAVPQDMLTAAERAVQLSDSVYEQVKAYERHLTGGNEEDGQPNSEARSAAIRALDAARTSMVAVRKITRDTKTGLT